MDIIVDDSGILIKFDSHGEANMFLGDIYDALTYVDKGVCPEGVEIEFSGDQAKVGEDGTIYFDGSVFVSINDKEEQPENVAYIDSESEFDIQEGPDL